MAGLGDRHNQYRARANSKDFEIRAPAGKTTVIAAIQTPMYTDPQQKTTTLPVINGVVQNDPARDIIKVPT